MVHHAGGEVLDDEITLRDQFFSDGNAFGGCQVQQQAFLPLIPLVEQRAPVYPRLHIFGIERQPPGQIRARVRLNLDHLCTEMREMHGAEGTRPHPAKVRYPHTFKREARRSRPESEVRSPASFWVFLDLSGTCFDLSETCLDFFVVFAEERRRRAYLPPRVMELVGCAEVPERPSTGMGHIDKEVSGVQLFLSGEVRHG